MDVVGSFKFGESNPSNIFRLGGLFLQVERLHEQHPWYSNHSYHYKNGFNHGLCARRKVKLEHYSFNKNSRNFNFALTSASQGTFSKMF